MTNVSRSKQPIDPATEDTAPPEPTTNGQVKSSRYSLDKMREAARQYSAEGGFQGEAELITVPVYSPPPSDEFIRVRDDDDYWIECMTLDYAPEGGRKETYFIATELMNLLPPEIKNLVKWSRLCTAIIRRGNVVFLWRIKVYDKGPGLLSMNTALTCAEKAKRLWVRVGWQDRKGYESYRAPGDFGEPQWPEKTFEELLDLAFQATYIDSLDHPVIRDLMGWAV
jgi:hypothetical protein